MTRFNSSDENDFNNLVEELSERGVRFLPSTESLYRDQRRMLAGFARAGIPESAWRHLEQCNANGCRNLKCSAACHFGERHQFLQLVKEAHDLLTKTGLPVWCVTVLEPSHKTEVLNKFSINALQQSLRRRFEKAERKYGARIFVFGGIEASYDIPLDGSPYRSPHTHLAIATSIPKKGLRKILRGRGLFPKHSKPVVIKPGTPERIANWFGYVVKRAPAQRTELRDEKGKRHWVKQPVEAEQRIEYDLWLLGLNNTQTLVLRGMKRFRGGLKLIEDGDRK